MKGRRVVYGLHAVTAALKRRPGAVFEVFVAGSGDEDTRLPVANNVQPVG